MEIDTLNTLVTEAIWRAEELEAIGIHPTSPARRGAVRAALKAGDYDRAQALTDAYLADDAVARDSQDRVAGNPGGGRSGSFFRGIGGLRPPKPTNSRLLKFVF